MARKKRAQKPEEDSPALEISSLIDVCFLLLIYFLVTTTIQKSERDVGIQTPGSAAATADSPPIPPLVILVDANGGIFKRSDDSSIPLDQDPDSTQVPLLDAEVELFAAVAAASGDEPIVQLRSENESLVQRSVTVMNTLMKHGITNIAITDLLDPES